MCAHLSHPVAFKQPIFRLPDTVFPPSASSCRVPPAVSMVGDFFCSGMGAFSAGNDSKARKALPALEHDLLIADACPVLDVQAQHAPARPAQQLHSNSGPAVTMDRFHVGLASVSAITV